MSRVSTAIVGAAGEYYVLSQLLRRGWIAALAPDGAPNMDILVTDELNKKLCAIQVKTRRGIGGDKGWHMSEKHENIIAPDLFYVFVDFGGATSAITTCHIIPSDKVAQCVRDSHQAWLDAPGRGGRPHKDNSMRRIRPDYSDIKNSSDVGQLFIDAHGLGWMDPYNESWSILGLPSASGF